MAARIVRWRLFFWRFLQFFPNAWFRLRYRDRRVSNWLGNQQGPAKIYRPRTLAALQEAVRQGAAQFGKVRAAGGNFAFSRMVPPTGLSSEAPVRPGAVIDTKHLTRVLGFGEVEGCRTVTVEAGIRIGGLSDILSRYGLALRSPTIMPYVRVGGAISTGSHGTGLKVATFSDSVVAMTVVDAHGALHHFDLDDPALFSARCGLGCFGIIYSVTLLVDEDRPMVMARHDRPFDEVMADLRSGRLLARHTAVELYWFPGSDEIVVLTFDEDDDARPTWRLWFGVFLWEIAQLVIFVLGSQIFHRCFRRWIPAYLRVAERWAIPRGRRVAMASSAFHYLPMYPRVYDAEWAVPLRRAADAYERIRAVVAEYAARGEYPFDLPTHARFIDDSNSYLAGAFLRESCYIEVTSSRFSPMPERVDSAPGTPPTAFDRLEDELAGLDGRPHWGKILIHAGRLRRAYASGLRNFRRNRDAFDPDRVFVNDFLHHQLF